LETSLRFLRFFTIVICGSEKGWFCAVLAREIGEDKAEWIDIQLNINGQKFLKINFYKPA
jgi:hypothetical protein